MTGLSRIKAQPRAVTQLNLAATESGARPHVLQFRNLLCHDQYAPCYGTIARYGQGIREVLDWGCGNGHLSFFLLTRGWLVTGYSYEPEPEAVIAHDNFTFVPGIDGDPVRLPFEDRRFDAVFSMGVLEHVSEFGGTVTASLTELRRVLRPGGLFFCFHLPNAETWIEPMVARFSKNAELHELKFRRDEIETLWSAHHFEILEMGRYNFLPRNMLGRFGDGMLSRVVLRRAVNAADAAGA